MGNLGFTELGFVLILWAIAIAIAIWFVRTLNGIAQAQRDIADSLRRLEHRLSSENRRPDPTSRPPYSASPPPNG